jgi:hypothetical protein
VNIERKRKCEYYIGKNKCELYWKKLVESLCVETNETSITQRTFIKDHITGQVKSCNFVILLHSTDN